MSSGNTTAEDGGGSGSSIEVEYNEIVSRSGWPRVYQDIRERSDRQAQAKDFTTNESKKMENRRLNRYRDVLPYDHSRVALKRGESDYINANLVKMERAGRKYILCQGPLPLTVGHFWLMVWEHDSRAILMLNKLIEQTTVKCHQYWPSKIGEKHRLELTGVNLSVVYLKCVEYKNFCRRTFRLTDTESGKSREVIQFHYMTWPDFGIPSSPVAFLQFLKEVRGSGTLDSDVGPPIIHCSAGIGRSGTFCLVDCCLVLIDKEGEDRVSVQDVLLELRQYRMGLIQTPDQLYFSYQAIIEGMKRMNNSSVDDFEELSVVSSSSQPASDHDTEENEDTPPPLPPPRTYSLTIGTKPLPLIPTSESVHEDFLLVNNGDRDKVNNLVNLEKSKQFESSVDDSNNHHHHTNNHRNRGSSNHNHHYHPYSNRPLPPVVREKPLCKVNESDSDGGGGGGGGGIGGGHHGGAGSYSNEASSGGSSSEEEELIEENDSDLNGEDEHDDDERDSDKLLVFDAVPSDHSDTVKSSLLDDSSTATSTTTTTTTTSSTTGGGSSATTATGGTCTGMSSASSSTTVSAIGSNYSTLESNRGGSEPKSSPAEAFNANSSLPPLPNGAVDDGEEMLSSPERELSPNASELRRRKRTERHTAMEEKIREIKRKQKEVESKGSPKKRRLFLFSIAAGVCFSVLCVYFYTKQM